MAFKVEFDFQQGMRSLGRMSRRAYDKVKDMTEEPAQEPEADAGSDREARQRDHDGD